MNKEIQQKLQDQRNQLPLDEPVLSHDEYAKKYDLDDAEVFQQQGNQLNLFEECTTLYAIMLKLSGSRSPSEHWQKMRIWNEEGIYFRQHLQSRVIKEELS